MQKFEITKRFVAGFLEGLTITEVTTVKFEVGKTYRAIGGSDYTILSVKPA